MSGVRGQASSQPSLSSVPQEKLFIWTGQSWEREREVGWESESYHKHVRSRARHLVSLGYWPIDPLARKTGATWSISLADPKTAALPHRRQQGRPEPQRHARLPRLHSTAKERQPVLGDGAPQRLLLEAASPASPKTAADAGLSTEILPDTGWEALSVSWSRHGIAPRFTSAGNSIQPIKNAPHGASEARARGVEPLTS